MPKNAEIHIQNTAPGPPVRIADTTPTMLPVPTVPEIAVENASNCETELSRVSFFLPPRRLLSVGIMVVFSDSPKCVTCKNFVRIVSRIPVPRIKMTTGQPQTIPLRKSLTDLTPDKMLSHMFFPPKN